ncbi:hypothetical protein F2Q68_00028999 [Brassica cretica]|uniref:Poly(A) polymerase nucleotidyltransferase domain-containing protein n=1 Tax=Brassica cretica TaxID=69181 RepID=A0A8S9GC61_BRACR|nr:hypothetical protein F2Q68_00028999 [Brassica cretica]
MLLSSSPPPSTLSAFVGLLKFVVGRLLTYWDPRNINTNGEFMGITLLLLEEKTASSNKTPDVDSQSILPAETVSYTIHVLRRAEEVDEAMSSFENEEKRHQYVFLLPFGLRSLRIVCGMMVGTQSVNSPKSYGITKPLSLAGPSAADFKRNLELEMFLVDEGLYESEEDTMRREEVLGRIDQVLAIAQWPLSLKVMYFTVVDLSSYWFLLVFGLLVLYLLFQVLFMCRSLRLVMLIRIVCGMMVGTQSVNSPKSYGITKPLSLAGPSAADFKRNLELEKGLYESEEDTMRREEVLGRIDQWPLSLKVMYFTVVDLSSYWFLLVFGSCNFTMAIEIVKHWVKQLTQQRGYTDQMVEDANAVIFTFGSYRLGVHGPGADIDTLCVGPSYVNRESNSLVSGMEKAEDGASSSRLSLKSTM